jgi:hypothetical protein
MLPWLVLVIMVALSIAWLSSEGIGGIWLHFIALILYVRAYYVIKQIQKNGTALAANISLLLSVYAWVMWIDLITSNLAV